MKKLKFTLFLFLACFVAKASATSVVLGTFEAAEQNLSIGEKWYDEAKFATLPSIGENEDKTGINTSENVFKVKNAAGHNWWGSFGQLTLTTPILIDEDTRYLKFMAYRSSQSFDLRICLNIEDKDSHEEGDRVFETKLSQAGAWESVVIDLQSTKFFGKTITSLVFVYNTNWGSNLGGDVLQMFDNFELSDNADVSVPVEVSAYPAEGGVVAGEDIYSAGSTVSLTATVNTGYTFAFWALSDGTFVSSDANYTKDLTGETAKSLSYIAYFKKNSDVYPNISIDEEGVGYSVEALEEGAKLFSNRDMTITRIPTEFSGYKFVQISGNSTYNPGTPPSFKIKPQTDGYVYAMVATNEKPDDSNAWITENGWELVPVYKATYKAGDPNGTLSFYRKMLLAKDWYTMVFPNVFSRATLIFPDTFTTGIEENTVSDKEVASSSLYTLTGAQVSTSATPKAGVYVLKTIYTDGTSASEKIMISETR